MLLGTRICMLYWRNYIKSRCVIAGLHCTTSIYALLFPNYFPVSPYIVSMHFFSPSLSPSTLEVSLLCLSLSLLFLSPPTLYLYPCLPWRCRRFRRRCRRRRRRRDLEAIKANKSHFHFFL